MGEGMLTSKRKARGKRPLQNAGEIEGTGEKDNLSWNASDSLRKGQPWGNRVLWLPEKI